MKHCYRGAPTLLANHELISTDSCEVSKYSKFCKAYTRLIGCKRESAFACSQRDAPKMPKKSFFLQLLV